MLVFGTSHSVALFFFLFMTSTVAVAVKLRWSGQKTQQPLKDYNRLVRHKDRYACCLIIPVIPNYFPEPFENLPRCACSVLFGRC